MKTRLPHRRLLTTKMNPEIVAQQKNQFRKRIQRALKSLSSDEIARQCQQIE